MWSGTLCCVWVDGKLQALVYDILPEEGAGNPVVVVIIIVIIIIII